jgi:hypothetical protein
MGDRREREAVPFVRVPLILMGVLAFYLLFSFVRQVSISRVRRADLRALEQQLVAAEEEQQELENLLDYAESNAAAEEWARENGWAKPGEAVVVVVAPPADGVPEGQNQPQPSAIPDSPVEAWWALFFGPD